MCRPRLFVGMILILIFAEVLGLYGLIVALVSQSHETIEEARLTVVLRDVLDSQYEIIREPRLLICPKSHWRSVNKPNRRARYVAFAHTQQHP